MTTKVKNDRSNCCVPQCNSSGTKHPALSFHRFPNDSCIGALGQYNAKRKRKWILALKMGKAVSNRMSVCSKHFEKDDYILPGVSTKRPRLKRTAVPSLYLPKLPSCIDDVNEDKKKAEESINRLLVMAKSITCKYPVNHFTAVSPLGCIEIISCTEGLHSVHFINGDDDENNELLQQSTQFELLQQREHCYPAVVDAAAWLEAYFHSPQSLAERKLPLLCPTIKPGKDSFEEAVWTSLTQQVPFGKTVSYQKLAEMAGHPGASRAVGNTMKRNSIGIIYPCHRVIKSDGSMGNYSGGIDIKRMLLRHEKDANH